MQPLPYSDERGEWNMENVPTHCILWFTCEIKFGSLGRTKLIQVLLTRVATLFLQIMNQYLYLSLI